MIRWMEHVVAAYGLGCLAAHVLYRLNERENDVPHYHAAHDRPARASRRRFGEPRRPSRDAAGLRSA